VGSCSLLGSEALERFFPERKMRIFVGTWNMCEMKTIPTSINDFLLPELSEYVQDAYVIGTQETACNRYLAQAYLGFFQVQTPPK